MSDNQLLLSYNRNDFFYASPPFLYSDPSILDSSFNYGNSVPLAINDFSCNWASDPKNREALKKTIEKNLISFIKPVIMQNQDTDLNEFVYNFKNNPISIDDMNYDANGSLKYNTDSYGVINGDMTLDINDITYNDIDSDEIYTEEVELDDDIVATRPSEDERGRTGDTITKTVSKCTKLHWHYKDASFKIYRDDNGDLYSKCAYRSPLVFDNTPHTHCDELSNADPDANLNENTIYNQTIIPPKAINEGLTNLDEAADEEEDIDDEDEDEEEDDSENSLDKQIQNIIITLNPNIIQQNMDINQPELNVEQMVNMIADYYISLCQNKEKATKLEYIIKRKMGAHQLYNDSNSSYNSEYIKIINLVFGILAISGFLYQLNKKK